ncbi:MAG: 3-hydroxyacyl-CoA dehydrogenase NAD-binding domain-containing protein [Dehalococcoidales bacterium]|nr:3-hydroxyacyl-CoA dehydrogenase NAD-binding domain-containing protein [Dehalococcoidales bacterium]
MPIKEIKKICVIGAGTMGLQISLVSAVHGYKVALYDVSGEAIKKAPLLHRQYAAKIRLGADAGKIGLEKALASIVYTTDAAAAAKDAGITSESVPEQVSLKQKIHAQFEKLCPPETILTTNTSSLLVSDIEPALQHPEKFVAMHFHSGLSPLVDVMKGNKAAAATIDTVARFVQSIGLVPGIMRKEKGGYLYNTMLGMWYVGGLISVADGTATPEEVDRAWMLVTGQSYGPFASMDAVGLDVIAGVGQGAAGGNSPLRALSGVFEVVRPYIERGELGVKTGKGFYTYPDPAFQQPGFLTGK